MSDDRQQTGTRRLAPLVLVVEDDAAYREMICSTLKEAGYAVLETSDGAQALRLLLSEERPQPAAIVLDLWLPVMSGPELLRVLKSYYRLSQIPVILISAGPRYSEAGLDVGWLSKPFEAAHLLALVRERAGPFETSEDPTGARDAS
jgi:CheY-like chemotaxis protein